MIIEKLTYLNESQWKADQDKKIIYMVVSSQLGPGVQLKVT